MTSNPMNAEEAVERRVALMRQIDGLLLSTKAMERGEAARTMADAILPTIAINRLGEPSREGELLAAAKVLVARYDFWMPEFQRLRAAILSFSEKS